MEEQTVYRLVVDMPHLTNDAMRTFLKAVDIVKEMKKVSKNYHSDYYQFTVETTYPETLTALCNVAKQLGLHVAATTKIVTTDIDPQTLKPKED